MPSTRRFSEGVALVECGGLDVDVTRLSVAYMSASDGQNSAYPSRRGRRFLTVELSNPSYPRCNAQGF